jgi:thiol:disulfide interchange protein DsbD
VYSLLGLLAGLTGSLFGAVASSPWAYFLTGNLLLVLGLALLDVFRVNVPQRIAAWAGRLGAGSPGGAFVMGAASGLVAAPCGAPAFAAVLTFVAATGSAVLGFVYLFVFSLGLTALLVAVGLSSGFLAALPAAGRWTLWVKRAGGVLLLLTAEYYFVRMGSVL